VAPEIANKSVGLAAKVPENGEPSDIDTERVAAVVPDSELSGTEAVAGVNVIPVGVGGGGGSAGPTVMVKLADAANLPFFPIVTVRHKDPVELTQPMP
jgi:hypothetical protein